MHAKMTLIACVALLMAQDAIAKDLTKGSVELSGMASYSRSSFNFDGEGVGTTTSFAFSPSVGCMVSRNLEVVGDLDFQSVSIDPDGDDDTSASTFGIAGSLLYNFQTNGNTVPYLGLGLGILSYGGDVDDAESSIVFPAAQAGVRFFITESSSLNLESLYRHISNAEGVEDFSNNNFALAAGFSVFFLK